MLDCWSSRALALRSRVELAFASTRFMAALVACFSPSFDLLIA
jgi:hypothetical protein